MALRSLLLIAFALVAVVVSGCGNKEEVRTLGETEGIYVDVGGLSYQVQLSRILNPNDVEDRSYLVGLPAASAPGRRETWFAIFMRVNNPQDETLPPTTAFTILDTQENEFTPVPIDTRLNRFAYAPARPLRPGEILPDPNSAAGEGGIQGAMILFKLQLTSLQNRPLELRIDPPVTSLSSGPAIIDLDV